MFIILCDLCGDWLPVVDISGGQKTRIFPTFEEAAAFKKTLPYRAYTSKILGDISNP